MLQRSRSEHTSPAWSAPLYTLSHCTAPSGHPGNHRGLHPGPWAHRFPGTRAFATVRSKRALEWQTSSLLPRWAICHRTECTEHHGARTLPQTLCERCPHTVISHCHFLLPATCVAQRGPGTCPKLHRGSVHLTLGQLSSTGCGCDTSMPCQL